MRHQRRERDTNGVSVRAWLGATTVALMAVTALASARQATPARPPAPAASFDELYAQGQRRNEAMKTLTARFTETTTSALLVHPLVARGTLAVERPSRVALHYTEPDARVIIIDGKTLTTSWPTKQTLDIGTAMGRVQKQFVNGSAADLRREFDIDDSQASRTPGTYYVTMSPKRKQIRETLTRLELWVNRGTLLLQSMRMTFASGESKTMTFEDVVPNAALPQGVFSPDRAPG
jgi:outer membrane lipoprotein-sorting protein